MRGHLRRVSTAALAGGLVLGMSLSACLGVIGGPEGDCEDCGPNGPVDPAAQLETTRFPRLSHAQWENTVRDLLYLSAPSELSLAFTGDPLGGVFDNNEEVLQVTPGLWADYQRAAETLASLVADDPAALAKIVPQAAPTDPRAFVEHFGKRAFRRPLSAAEIDSYVALFAQAPALVDGTDDFVKGVKLALQAFLQSPHFLYRVEATSEVGAKGLIYLNNWEIATKLSYMLWNTMPDDALFAAAEGGKLVTPEGVMAEAQRMIDDDRSRPMVAAFHAQLYQYDHYLDLYKDEIIFPDFVPEAGADMETEATMFIEDVVYGGGGLRELLTSPFTYVNDRLAAIYGLEGTFGPEFERVELNPAERAGFLTRLGFLASNATPKEQNTIHRGVFVNTRILCNTIPSPPDNVPGLPPADNFATNRERVESHTGAGTCAEGCHHVLINPPGYALEHYNAVGTFQETEKGNPVNAFAEYNLDDAPVTFDGAIQMSQLFAESDQAHRCYAKHWIEFGYGRRAQDGDEPTLDTLGKSSKSGSVKDLLLAMTQTAAFRTRAPAKEVAP
jgi:hypothetical protein